MRPSRRFSLRRFLLAELSFILSFTVISFDGLSEVRLCTYSSSLSGLIIMEIGVQISTDMIIHDQISTRTVEGFLIPRFAEKSYLPLTIGIAIKISITCHFFNFNDPYAIILTLNSQDHATIG